MIFEGQSLTCQMLDDGIANVCFDNKNESVNKFDKQTLNELKTITEALKANKDVKGAIVTSGKGVFIVGADITEFQGLFANPREELLQWTAEANQIFTDFQDLPFPTVAAVNGFALGGGMEMILCCDLRVASTDAQVGLPETKLGLIPGFGGTTRLPRVIGSDNAIEWIATAKPSKPDAALKVGAIDAVCEADQLQAVTLQMVKDAINGSLDWQQRREQKKAPLKLNKLEATMAFTTAKGMVGAKAGKNYPAPMEAIRVIEEGAGLNQAEALKIEHDGFVNMAKTSQASAMIQIFLNDQLLKKKAKIAGKAASKTIKQAGVLGAGIMGGGIAYQSSVKGVPAVMKDIKQDALDLGMGEAMKILGKGMKIGKVSAEKMAKTISNIKPTLNYDDIKPVDIVVEAVVENPKVKDAVLCEAEQLIADDAILTSNTSTISIDLLAKNLKRPENFCGMHFFNPVHKMPLVEVIRGEKSSDETVAAVVAYASAIGKSPIVVKDCPGFFVNRVLFPYFRGFSQLLQEGADFRQVDKVMEKFGWPMGPSYLLDVVGIDTAVHCVGVMAEGFPDRMSALDKDPIEQLYKQDKYGQKSGSGFYVYSKDKKGRPQKDVDDSVFDIIGKPGKEFSNEEIVERLMIPMIFEVARCFEEGIIETPAEADMGLIYGLGFPPFRGGALKYADEVGIETLVKQAEKYKHLGEAYTAPEGVAAMAKDGKTFYSA
ncbi:fatty acid oxidation complex subunit alpha FadB [Pleionea mediterranea]|uniref:enoyl-CoA hydratase n=1 Tax=Pleionea mediterranea TaxID=523701 RepID=A0A316FBY8_9GAMM|nr:fatty acid oxidation complex subunit alpha FadB [Pleionea mediterranea]PWK46391.1 3-hydroxyacyl-CoA dehydrogenase/enoyl-CoA hydratase/3-hydroxybutyryl-CoA epimerase/enoyl-CoA isomerase [Pleionea mediterranea]